MSTRRILVPALSIVVLACGSLTAHAQFTGPIKKGPSGSKSISASSPQTVQDLTPEKVVSLLQAKGAETTLHNQTINGVKFTSVRTKMNMDDFGYDFDVFFVTYANGGKNWYLSAPLNTSGTLLPLEKLQGLLKRNYTMCANYSFMIDPQSGTLLMQTSRLGLAFSDQQFHTELGVYLKNIKDGYQYWGNE